MQKTIEFTKMHGCGNNYIYVDTTRFPINNPEHLSLVWSDVNKGIGGDGLILIGKNDAGEFTMRIFNNDGSEAMMCGNGTRCVAKYLYEKGLTKETEIPLRTLSGIKVLQLHLSEDKTTVESVTVDMDAPLLAVKKQCATEDGSLREGAVKSTKGEEFVGTFVSMGNPHFVIFVDDAETFDVSGIGPTLEFSPAFPERCNIEFATIRPDGSIRMRVWERGSGITMACGTGACATAVAAALTGRCGRSSVIAMDGGDLSIEWDETTDHVMMTGPAVIAFEGRITYEE